jgi:beta-N-acetylhexosaminidase
MIKKIILVMCVFLLLVAAVGCSKAKESAKENIGIRGQITELSLNDSGKVTEILVEGKIEQDTAYDKARVFIGDKTKIYKNDTKEELKVADLKKGAKVEIVFEGPVRESYPVQADAKIIRIIE